MYVPYCAVYSHLYEIIRMENLHIFQYLLTHYLLLWNNIHNCDIAEYVGTKNMFFYTLDI